LRNLLNIAVFVVLFSPTNIGNIDDMYLYAPSSIIIALNILFDMGDSFVNTAIVDLLKFSAIMLALYFFVVIIQFIKFKIKNNIASHVN